jgi:hypothetical protein
VVQHGMFEQHVMVSVRPLLWSRVAEWLLEAALLLSVAGYGRQGQLCKVRLLCHSIVCWNTMVWCKCILCCEVVVLRSGEWVVEAACLLLVAGHGRQGQLCKVRLLWISMLWCKCVSSCGVVVLQSGCQRLQA